ncbi:MAG: hypothetical protein NTZ42_02130 [Candidatus Gribaldobacteria bacterium]|nr:hypothetical protein [Candidatus Gribaldobacteria bacterium]
MSRQYLFQKKKCYFTQRLFDKGLNAAACILFALKESGEDFLRGLPSSYPEFKFWKDMFGAADYPKPSLKDETVRINIQRLIKDGLVAQEQKSRKFLLTKKGKELVDYIENRYQILEKLWDGKFRIVIFDIPEVFKSWRGNIRQELLLLQFQQLQRSVYIGKYPVPESFCRELDEWNLGKYVFIFTVDKIDREDNILKLFT